MKSEKIVVNGNFCVLLAILFIGLKLTGYIAWSWLWVLAPLWIPVAFGLTLLLIAVAVAAVANRF